MKAVSGVIPETGRPCTRTWPAETVSSPATRVSVVDLPQPVGPTTAQNSPSATDMSRSRRAVKAVPAGVRNRFVTAVSSMAGVPAGSGADGGAGISNVLPHACAAEP